MTEPFEQIQIHQPPPGGGSFDGDLGGGRILGEELLDLSGVVIQAVLGHLTLRRQDGDLRDSLVEIDTDRYHNLGLLPQGVLGGPL